MLIISQNHQNALMRVVADRLNTKYPLSDWTVIGYDASKEIESEGCSFYSPNSNFIESIEQIQQDFSSNQEWDFWKYTFFIANETSLFFSSRAITVGADEDSPKIIGKKDCALFIPILGAQIAAHCSTLKPRQIWIGAVSLLKSGKQVEIDIHPKPDLRHKNNLHASILSTLIAHVSLGYKQKEVFEQSLMEFF